MVAGRALALVGLLALLGGCGFEPFDPPRMTDTPPGPGLITGHRGEWVILRPDDPPPPTPPVDGTGTAAGG